MIVVEFGFFTPGIKKSGVDRRKRQYPIWRLSLGIVMFTYLGRNAFLVLANAMRAIASGRDQVLASAVEAEAYQNRYMDKLRDDEVAGLLDRNQHLERELSRLEDVLAEERTKVHTLSRAIDIAREVRQ